MNIREDHSKQNIFFRIVNKINSKTHVLEIMKAQRKNFFLYHLGAQGISENKALQLYKRFHHKYYVSKQYDILPWAFHSQEKKIFGWFMMVYKYFAEDQKKSINDYEFKEIGEALFEKEEHFIKYQYLSILRQTKRAIWTGQMDQFLIQAVAELSQGQKLKQDLRKLWSSVSIKIYLLSKDHQFRSSKQCRQRWENHLNPKTIRKNWTQQQDLIILQYVVQGPGKNWARINQLMEEKRTQHMVKNRYRHLIAKIKKKTNQSQEEIAKSLLARLKQQKILKLTLSTELIKKQAKDIEQVKLQEISECQYDRIDEEYQHIVAMKHQQNIQKDEAVKIQNQQQAKKYNQKVKIEYNQQQQVQIKCKSQPISFSYPFQHGHYYYFDSLKINRQESPQFQKNYDLYQSFLRHNHQLFLMKAARSQEYSKKKKQKKNIIKQQGLFEPFLKKTESQSYENIKIEPQKYE